MSEHDISLVTGQAGATVVEGQKVTLGSASAGITPATLTAMIGINQGTALRISPTVEEAINNLSNIAYSDSSANTAANAALANLTSLHSSLGFGGTPNHAAFGSFLNQAQGHIGDSLAIVQSTNFMANLDYADFGTGIKDIGSMADRGLSNSLGNLPSVGALIESSGSMFNGIDMKNFGTPTGLVQALRANKLANATDVNAQLAAAGVDLDNLDDPVYTDQINNVMAGIKNPATISMVAEQFDVANAPGGLPQPSTVKYPIEEFKYVYLKDQSAMYVGGEAKSASDVTYTVKNPTTGYVIANGTYNQVYGKLSSFSSAMPDSIPLIIEGLNSINSSIQSQIGPTSPAGVKSLADLSDPSKLAGPSLPGGISLPGGLPVPGGSALPNISSSLSLPSFPGGASLSGMMGSLSSGASSVVSGISTLFKDLGATVMKNASAAPALFSQIQSVSTPLHNQTFPSLSGMVSTFAPMIKSMTGSGNGPLGLPNMRDFTQHISGGPDVLAFNANISANVLAVDPSVVTAFNNTISSASSLWSTAGVDLTSPPPNTLGSSMSFATNLHKFGADTSGSGIAGILHDLADTTTPYGEAIKASLVEGKNKELLQANGIAPIKSEPPANPVKKPGLYPARDSETAWFKEEWGGGGWNIIGEIAAEGAPLTIEVINTSGKVIKTGTYDETYGFYKSVLSAAPNTVPVILETMKRVKSNIDSILGNPPKVMG